MKSSRLIQAGLKHYWRSHVGVALGAAVAVAVLVGALAVGDSVRHSLRQDALNRLGTTEHAIAAGERFFRQELASQVAADLPDARAAAVLMTPASASRMDDTARVNGVQLVGVDDDFWTMGQADDPFAAAGDGDVVLSRTLADRLGVGPGDKVQIHLQEVSLLAREAPMSKADRAAQSATLIVRAVIGPEQFSRFSLQAEQIPPANAFVRIQWLQRRLELEGKANILLVGSGKGGLRAADATAALNKHFRLADAGIELREIERNNAIQFRTPEVFLPDPVVTAIRRAHPEATGTLTYFLDRIEKGDLSAPYPVVAAVGPLGDQPAPTPVAKLTEGLDDEKIVINDWLATDLDAKAGDEITLHYWMLGEMRKLQKRSTTFTVAKVVPLQGLAEDSELFPDYPGLAGTESCGDWDPGVPVDVRSLDRAGAGGGLQEYWETYYGTPKGFVTLEAGQKLWANRFGKLTGVRVSLEGTDAQAVEQAVLAKLSPADVGLVFQPVRQQGLRASREGVDFGTLFVSLSFFLVVAAVLLMTLLFVFGIEQRSREVGTLRAVGLTGRQVGRLILGEGVVLVLAGAVVGVFGGLGYTRAILWALNSVWAGAVAESTLSYHATAGSVLGGAIGGIVVALLAMAWTLRRQRKQPVRSLLAGGAERELNLTAERRRSRLGLWLGGAMVLLAVVLAVFGPGLLTWGPGGAGAEVAVFFSSGSLLLIGGLVLTGWALRRASTGRSRGVPSIWRVGVRSAGRRRGRSVATVALLACGTFLMVAVGANRQNPADQAGKIDGPTGGFEIFAQTSLPIYHDITSQEGRDTYLLTPENVQGVQPVYFRMTRGDDASCLNLNRTRQPRLMGVDPHKLDGRFKWLGPDESTSSKGSVWEYLEDDLGPDVIPAIGDEPTVVWGLGKSLGDELEYTDDRGNTFAVRIVGIIGSSVLQGNLLISEDDFRQRFPTQTGYRAMLVDTPPDRADDVAALLSEKLSDVGLSATTTVGRMEMFGQVTNTYLTIFQILGGLGLLLGSVGLAVVVLRNVMERRGELAVMRAVGLSRGKLRGMVLAEHALLLAVGLVLGVVSALVAVAPALSGAAGRIPVTSMVLLLAGVLVGGLLWVVLATRAAVRGSLLAALRNE